MASNLTLGRLPQAARSHLVGARCELIYNPYLAATWRVEHDSGRITYLKAAPAGMFPSLAAERDRMVWLHDHGMSVPEVLDYGQDNDVEWLVTAALPGRPATDEPHLREPERTVPILAEGLRAFHELDPTGCPFDWRIPRAVDHATARVRRGDVDRTGFNEPHLHLTASEALERLHAMLPLDEPDLVVSHGDYCFPNVMIDDGAVVGYLDLGEAGVADRWRDLAVATWSVTWNVGPGYEDLFLEAYGADWDLERRDFYRLLYDLES